MNVAKNLLGATLCSTIGGKLCSGKIVELEVYVGACDRACHAYPNKKTPRNAVMFGPGGHAYVYFVYGMHHMFNIVVGGPGTANAILIRALEPVDGIEVMMKRRRVGARRDVPGAAHEPPLQDPKTIRNLCNGPAKLTAALGITTKHNGYDLTIGEKIWVEPRVGQTPKIATGPRIGVDYAGADAALPWRFVISGNKFISKPI